MAGRPEELAPGVWRIPTLGKDLVNSFAFVDGHGSVGLVDAGLRGATRRLVAALAVLGKKPTDVTRIVVTHGHFDHIGGARRLRDRTGAAVEVHDHDAGYVRSGRTPPVDRAAPGAWLLALHRHQSRSDVDATFSEGDVLEVGGGLRVLHTPGHTPGHCSFLHEPSGVLITGDALMNWGGKTSYSFGAGCTDYKMSVDTADRLGEVDYEIAAFTHGPAITSQARPAVQSFLSRRLKGR